MIKITRGRTAHPSHGPLLREGTIVAVNSARRIEAYRSHLEKSGLRKDYLKFYVMGYDYPVSLRCRVFPGFAVDHLCRRDIDRGTLAELTRRVR